MEYHRTSGEMFGREERETPEFKAVYKAKELQGTFEKIRAGEITKEGATANIITLRNELLDLISEFTNDDKKFEYRRIVIECDKFLPEAERSQSE